MIIGGFLKFSLIDYPGKTSAVIFTRGCNFRCPYCYNAELVLPEAYGREIDLSSVFTHLNKRRGKLDAVTITGGEPTLHDDLIVFIKQIKTLGYLVKVDTNGSRPEIIRAMLHENIVDYIAMDIKAPFDDYVKMAGVAISIDKLKKSIGLIMQSGIDYEFRTTVVGDILSEDDLLDIALSIKGARKFYLQKFIPAKPIDPNMLSAKTYDDIKLRKLAGKLSEYVDFCGVR